MEEHSNHSEEIHIPENNIRSVEKNLLTRIKSFEEKIPERADLETCNICDEVKNQILYSEDEPILSKTYNISRRLDIASELFMGICSTYERVVDFQVTRIIREMIQHEKYERIYRKILEKLKREQKTQQYFEKKAQGKLVKGLDDLGRLTVNGRQIGDVEIPEEGSVENRERPQRSVENFAVETLERPEHVSEPVEVTDVGIKPTESLLRLAQELPSTKSRLVDISRGTEFHETLDDILSHISRNVTEMRGEVTVDPSHPEYSISEHLRQDITIPRTLTEVSVEDFRASRNIDENINEILNILEDQQLVGEIERPDDLEITNKVTENVKETEIEDLKTGKEIQIGEESEEWTLPRLEPTKDQKEKHRHLIIDQVAVIHDYAAKALKRNRNIQIQRVQVYEGPPKILQAMSANYLMTTPGCKSSLFHSVRNSGLSKLYERHLITEKKPDEPVDMLKNREKKKQGVDISIARVEADLIEEVGRPVGMRLELEKSGVLAEVPAPPEKIQKESIPTEIPAIVPEVENSLVGVPVSRIIQGKTQPPERISATSALPIERVRALQGTTLEPKPTTQWFISTKENPPSEKYRDFHYVYNQLQEYWLLFENQGMEKSITIKEFLAFEKNEGIANYLTVLRIVDKMSVQRKILLKQKNNDVIITPFETPYVSEKQMLFKGEPPIL